MPKRQLLIDGIKPTELVKLDDLEAYTLANHPIVFAVGEAEVLAEFSKLENVIGRNSRC